MIELDEKPRVYLSYSARDEASAIKVSRALTEAGCSIFSANESEAHSSWFKDFKTAMEETDAMILIASPEMIASPNTAFDLVPPWL